MSKQDAIDQLNSDIEEALAEGNQGEAEELYRELEDLCMQQ